MMPKIIYVQEIKEDGEEPYLLVSKELNDITLDAGEKTVIAEYRKAKIYKVERQTKIIVEEKV